MKRGAQRRIVFCKVLNKDVLEVLISAKNLIEQF